MTFLISELSTYVPPDIKNIYVEFKGGVRVEGIVLKDQFGNTFKIENFLDGKRPVILIPMYYNCPVVCSTVLLKTYESLLEITDLKPGKDYKVLVFSFNHENTVKDAYKNYEAYKSFFGSSAAFTVSDSVNIYKLTSLLGYRFKKLRNGLYAHPVAIFTLTPDGRTSGIIYDFGKISPMDIRLSLLEASDGNIGNNKVINQFLLYCFHYNSASRRYEVVVWNLVKIWGVMTLIFISLLFAYIYFRKSSALKYPR